jgi:hypothetical protein
MLWDQLNNQANSQPDFLDYVMTFARHYILLWKYVAPKSFLEQNQRVFQDSKCKTFFYSMMVGML